ncbi:hypothetical protein [Fibrobacter sp. UWP2]|uniref:hypothetical protein n=1 Tax=Fibrobacter sp. UWP2 TaxID=1896216 RepID=UPI00091ACA56|nr:hypothetical protein [Fibrobacter sp. UWP2]SHJ08773.1 hypothetical protein SAMN05720471_11644 [Fibrobacter sp. UWP2]
MKKNLPGILFLVAMPVSVWLFVKVEALSGSEFVGLLAAVLLYVVIGLLVALIFGKKGEPRE